MAQTNRTPPVALGGVQRELGGSRSLDKPQDDQTQWLASRHRIRPALLATIAAAAFGGARG